MMWFVVCAVALGASALTLISGFGLGTLLMPAFAAFFPLPVAIAATAVVHLVKNLSSLMVAAGRADRHALVSFGVPSLIGAACGAWALSALAGVPRLWTYSLGVRSAEVTAVKIAVAVVIVGFALADLFAPAHRATLGRRWFAVGGLASGFFGGLSGHQGALRSAFLSRAGMSKEAFVGTGVVISVAVDAVRLGVYGLSASDGPFSAAAGAGWGLVAAASCSAFAGTWLGAIALRKVTIETVRVTVAVMLLLAGALLLAGVI